MYFGQNLNAEGSSNESTLSSPEVSFSSDQPVCMFGSICLHATRYDNHEGDVPSAEERKKWRVGAPILVVVLEVRGKHVAYQLRICHHDVVLPYMHTGESYDKRAKAGGRGAYQAKKVEAYDRPIRAHPFRHDVPRCTTHHVLGSRSVG